MTFRRLVGVGAVAVAGAAVAAAGAQRADPVVPVAHPQRVAVSQATLACPGVPGPDAAGTNVSAVSPDPGAVAVGPARLQVTGPDDASPLAATPHGGARLRVALSGAQARQGVQVSAGGALAPGVSASQVSSYASKDADGIAAVACSSARTQWWFPGIDTSVGTTTTLVLSNPGPAASAVDLHFLSVHGELTAAGSNGIGIPPRSRVTLDLARYAPGHASLGLHLTATSGSVAAAVATSRVAGVTPAGSDWVAAAAEPRPTVVVGPGVATVGGQRLVVANPTGRQELVTVRILDRDGAFTSTKLAKLQVPPESVVARAVASIVHRSATAIELSASAPVTGAIVSSQTDLPRDFAVSTASLALGTPAVAPVSSSGAMTLAFSTARPEPAVVRVSGMTALGRVVGASLVHAAGSATTTWAVPVPWRQRAAYLVVAVASGSDVHAVATVVTKGGITQLPLVSAPRSAVRPAVLPQR